MITYKEFLSLLYNQTATTTDTVENVVENTIEDSKSDLVEESESKKAHQKEELNEKAEVVPTGYKIYRDKSENFVCDMEISGANPTNSKARIIIESKDLTYMFEGNVDAHGKCKIPLKKMNFLSENEKGIIKLEVIADDTVFTPWKDNFIAVNSKKVDVKVYESTEDSTTKIGVRLKNIR